MAPFRQVNSKVPTQNPRDRRYLPVRQAAPLYVPRRGRLRHDQRAARAGFGLAEAAEATTGVAIGDWSLLLSGDTYRALEASRALGMELVSAQPYHRSLEDLFLETVKETSS